MELDHQSLFGLLLQLYSLAETPRLPTHWVSYTRALLVSQDRRHLFVTPLPGSVDFGLACNSCTYSSERKCEKLFCFRSPIRTFPINRGASQDRVFSSACPILIPIKKDKEIVASCRRYDQRSCLRHFPGRRIILICQDHIIIFFFLGDFLFFSYCIQHCFICRPSDSTVPTDAGIEPRTVATSALAVRRSNH
jgi:hypothetical protein